MKFLEHLLPLPYFRCLQQHTYNTSKQASHMNLMSEDPVLTPTTSMEPSSHHLGAYASSNLSPANNAGPTHISTSRSCPPGPWASPQTQPQPPHEQGPVPSTVPVTHTMNSMASNYSINGSHRLNNQLSLDSSGSVGGLGVPSLTAVAANRPPPHYSEALASSAPSAPRTTGLFQATGTAPSFTSHNSHSWNRSPPVHSDIPPDACEDLPPRTFYKSTPVWACVATPSRHRQLLFVSPASENVRTIVTRWREKSLGLLLVLLTRFKHKVEIASAALTWRPMMNCAYERLFWLYRDVSNQDNFGYF